MAEPLNNPGHTIMNDSRSQILKRIQGNVSFSRLDENIETGHAKPNDQSCPLVQPPLGNDVVEAFIQAALNSDADVHHLNSLKELPEWLRNKAAQLCIEPRLTLSPDLANVYEEGLPFSVHPRPEAENSWGLCHALIGIAETGTVVSTSKECARGSLFLVERLIVLINKSEIVAYQEDAWKTIRSKYNNNLPRAINLITGPSRTADVEQTIQLGAHGPRWVDYIILG